MRHVALPAYKTYQGRCKEARIEPVDWKKFLYEYSRQKKVILFQLDLGRKNPFMATPLDERFILYSGVTGDKVVLNVWSKDEFEALTGAKGRAQL